MDFNIGDDELGLEETESYTASLEIVGNPLGVLPGLSSAKVLVIDDDGKYTCRCGRKYIQV